VRRNWFIGAIVIGVAAIVIAAVVMRLSDDGPPTTEEWAGSVCTSLSDWNESIASLHAGGEPLTADSLRDKLGDASDVTSDLVTQLRDLGPPDLESGDELEQQLDASVDELESSYDSLENRAQEVADAPAGEFLQQLAALGSDFAAFQTAIAGTVTTLQNADVAESSKAELQQAFADAPSCESLRSES
jgi:hypothetical protein